MLLLFMPSLVTSPPGIAITISTDCYSCLLCLPLLSFPYLTPLLTPIHIYFPAFSFKSTLFSCRSSAAFPLVLLLYIPLLIHFHLFLSFSSNFFFLSTVFLFLSFLRCKYFHVSPGHRFFSSYDLIPYSSILHFPFPIFPHNLTPFLSS